MAYAEEIARRLAGLKTAAQEFSQFVNLIDGNFEGKVAEIKNLEMKRDNLKDELDDNTRKAQEILNSAYEESAKVKKEASQILSEAQIQKSQAKDDKEEAIKLKQEADALKANALQRQKEADTQYKIYSDKVETLKKAVSA